LPHFFYQLVPHFFLVCSIWSSIICLHISCFYFFLFCHVWLSDLLLVVSFFFRWFVIYSVFSVSVLFFSLSCSVFPFSPFLCHVWCFRFLLFFVVFSYRLFNLLFAPHSAISNFIFHSMLFSCFLFSTWYLGLVFFFYVPPLVW
jgi:hypothetical protein